MDFNPPLVDAQGRELYRLGELAWAQHNYKGWHVSLEWFVGARTSEPMMAIWPEVNEAEGGAWCICLSSVGKFCEFDGNGRPTGTPTLECFTEAADALVNQFDRAPLDADLNGLVDTVMRFIPDLITGVPPTPLAVKRAAIGQACWEVTRIENGVKIEEASI